MGTLHQLHDRPDSGFLYVLRCPAFARSGRREYLKVGRTSRPVEERLAELNTAVPSDFEVVSLLQFDDARAAESQAHDALRRWRIRGDREFFYCTVATALSELDHIFNIKRKTRWGFWLKRIALGILVAAIVGTCSGS